MNSQFKRTPPDFVTVERWYDRRSRNWVVQRKDANGYQVGSADYCGTKEWAMEVEKEYNDALKGLEAVAPHAELWHADGDAVRNAHGDVIARCHGGVIGDMNAARIALAVNAHDAMLAALQKLLRAIDRMPASAVDGLADEARAAIAVAKGAA